MSNLFTKTSEVQGFDYKKKIRFLFSLCSFYFLLDFQKFSTKFGLILNLSISSYPIG